MNGILSKTTDQGQGKTSGVDIRRPYLSQAHGLSPAGRRKLAAVSIGSCSPSTARVHPPPGTAALTIGKTPASRSTNFSGR